MTLYISVKRETIVNNAKLKRNDPPFEIRKSKDDPTPRTVDSIYFQNCAARLVYDKKNPLICGAVCWLEIDEAPTGIASCGDDASG